VKVIGILQMLLINDYLHNGNYLVEYLTRKTYDLT